MCTGLPEKCLSARVPRSKRNSRSTAVAACPCVSYPNSQAFGPLHCLEYACPLVGQDVLFNSSAGRNTNICLVQCLESYVLICSFHRFRGSPR